MPKRRQWACALLLLVVGLSEGIPVAASAEVREMQWPAQGRITQNYGCTGFRTNSRKGRCAHFHNGIDIANSAGTPIRAAAAGVVSHVGWNPWVPRRRASFMVIIDHGSGLRTWYAHLQARTVKGMRKGSRVLAGQLIGYMGMTGVATGNHLHFMVQKRGDFVNPRGYLSRRAAGAAQAKQAEAVVSVGHPGDIDHAALGIDFWLWPAVRRASGFTIGP